MNACHHENEHLLRAKNAKENMPSERTVEELSRVFKAICEPSRLKILFALRQGDLCVYHIVDAVGGTQSAVSHQLRILRDARVIKVRREGQNALYSLADGHVVALLELSCAHLNCKF